MRIFICWLINAIALLLLPYLVTGIHLRDFTTALIVVIILGFINTIIRPLLILLTLPITLLSLGLFIFVINAALFLFAGDLISGFVVTNFTSALRGSLLYSLFSWALTSLFLGKKNRTNRRKTL